jgi:hypothetical protein
VDPTASIGPRCIVGRGARIGSRTVLHAGAAILDEARVGADCVLWTGAVVRERCVLGDRVVLQPNADAPDTIQIFGIFSIAVPNDPNDYRPAARGYLYFNPGKDAAAARREWSDLKTVAGTGQLVAFGSRYASVPRLRQPDEKPVNPDAYVTNIGLQKVQGRGDYAPIRALLDYRP